jgi:hypothetical protein
MCGTVNNIAIGIDVIALFDQTVVVIRPSATR